MVATGVSQGERIDARRERIGLWSLTTALLLIACHVALGLLRRSPYIVYFGGPFGQEHVEALAFSFFTLALIIGFGCLVPPLFNRVQPSWRRKVAKVIVAGVLILASAFGALITGLVLLVSTGDRYYSFDSPVSNERVVVVESSSLLHGQGAIYQQRTGAVYEHIHTYPVNDGTRPIGRGQYSIDWTARSVTLHLTFEGFVQEVTTPLKRW